MKKILFVLLILSVVLLGCTSQKSPAPAGGLGIKNDVEISGFAFAPASITVPLGTTVIWTNKDAAPHTIVSDSGNEIQSGTLNQGGTFAHLFEHPGTFGYHCSIHPSMKGTVIVQDTGATGTQR